VFFGCREDTFIAVATDAIIAAKISGSEYSTNSVDNFSSPPVLSSVPARYGMSVIGEGVAHAVTVEPEVGEGQAVTSASDIAV
jgi:hypothetical protein